MSNQTASAALELTYVLYNAESHVSLALALITLSPILLMASYAALAVVTRELVVIEMWAGQLACEGFNWILKTIVKQERPVESIGSGYGFPSSHSQYMGYFATFLMLHLHFRHRFPTTGYSIVDQLWRGVIYAGLVGWASAVCYSRFHLTYHSSLQVLWGAAAGIAFGAITYAITEYIPSQYPKSVLGCLRSSILVHPIASWFRIRDGWAVWADGGHEAEWHAWRTQWEKQRLAEISKRKKSN